MASSLHTQMKPRLKKMFLSISGAAVASNLGSATEIITNGILVDIAAGVDGFFDEYDDGTIFRGSILL